MAIEESSVVAAASKAAKFWAERGGFKAEVISTKKVGQVHFTYFGEGDKLRQFFKTVKSKLYEDTSSITKNMELRVITSYSIHYTKLYEIYSSQFVCLSLFQRTIQIVVLQF